MLTVLVLQGLLIRSLLKHEDSTTPVQYPEIPGDAGGFRLVGYYPNYKREAEASLESLDLEGLTHLHYAFVGIGEDLKLTLMEPETDPENFRFLRRLREDQGTRILISVGGGGSAQRFPLAVAHGEDRERFARSCVDFLEAYDLDGIDFDWEYPEDREECSDYVKFLALLRQLMEEKTRETGRKYLISVTCPLRRGALKHVDPRALAEPLDYLFLMGYDLHGSWEDWTDFNAPLYPADPGTPNEEANVRDIVAEFITEGFPARKMVLGVPFYVNLYELSQESETGLHEPYDRAWQLSYGECRLQYLKDPAFRHHYDVSSAGDWLWDGHTFISLESPRSLTQKTMFARAMGFGGIGIWELTQDFKGELKNALREACRP